MKQQTEYLLIAFVIAALAAVGAYTQFADESPTRTKLEQASAGASASSFCLNKPAEYDECMAEADARIAEEFTPSFVEANAVLVSILVGVATFGVLMLVLTYLHKPEPALEPDPEA